MKEMYAALTMVRKGAHPAEVARKYRVTPCTVRNWCRRANIPFPKKPPGPERLPVGVRRLAAAMVLRDGKRLAEVAEALFLSKSMVSRCCSEFRRELCPTTSSPKP